MSFLLIPLFILLAILLTFGIVILLARFRNGRYLRPIILWLSKVPWLRKQFEKASRAAIEKQNPELASAMRKLKRAGPNPDPVKAQQALSQLSATERRAYMDAVQEQGSMPEPANRQQRRMAQRMQQGTRPPTGGSGAKKQSKKKR